MGIKTGISLALVAAVLMAAIVSGCGSGGSSSSPGSSSSAGSTSSSGESSSSSETEASAQFKGSGPNSKIATFGQEADSEEREAASEVLEENLKARAARDFAGQCSSLTKGAIKVVDSAPTILHPEGCAKDLEAQANGAPESVLANSLTGPIDALRIKGEKAFALYHGTHGKDYAMPMEKEGGEWKVGSVVTQEVP